MADRKQYQREYQQNYRKQKSVSAPANRAAAIEDQMEKSFEESLKRLEAGLATIGYPPPQNRRGV